MLEKLGQSWKAVVALVLSFVAMQLPQLEVFVQDWVQSLVSAAFVAVGVWLKANEPAA